MILGLSLIFAFLSYLIYRRLLLSSEATSSSRIAGTGTGSPIARNSTSQAIPMWPFLSTLLQQSSASSSATSSTIVASTTTTATVKRLLSRSPEPSPPPVVVIGAPVTSPDSTPKATPAAPTTQTDAISQISLSSPTVEIHVADDDDGDDYVPSFPSLNSAQRASGGVSSLTSSNSMSLPSLSSSPKPSTLSMPPPSIPIRGRNPKANIRYATIPLTSVSPPSTASVLRQNPNGAARSRLTAMGIGASGVAAGSGLTLPNSKGSASSSSKSRKKVILEPGHSPLDWARLQRSGIDLRGLPHTGLIKVSPSLLAQHSKAPDDIWTALNGRVYNITAYLPFHPGGEKDLLRGAGKDGTKLFNATHPWVNVEGMLAECLIGIFVSEEEAAASNGGLESALDSVD